MFDRLTAESLSIDLVRRGDVVGSADDYYVRPSAERGEGGRGRLKVEPVPLVFRKVCRPQFHFLTESISLWSQSVSYKRKSIEFERFVSHIRYLHKKL